MDKTLANIFGPITMYFSHDNANLESTMTVQILDNNLIIYFFF